MLRLALLAVFLCGAPSQSLAEPIERDHVFVKDGDKVIVLMVTGFGPRTMSTGQLTSTDAPETGTRARCPADFEKRLRAAARLLALLDSGLIQPKSGVRARRPPSRPASATVGISVLALAVAAVGA